MNWFKRTPEHVIPNPRDNRRRQEHFQAAQQGVLSALQFLVFALAFLILLEVM